jgi:tetratricopeptide (TPR) repeat protein/transcriptional regulator with XRE-family HTH domain
MGERPEGVLAVGGRLRRARIAAGMTQEELAMRSGVSVRAISDLERGRTRRPYPRSIRLLASALRLPEPAGEELVGLCRGDRAEEGEEQAGPRPLPDVPRQLPARARSFVGRARAQRVLDDLAAEARDAAVICVVSGIPGVGKTAVAVHWAHQAAERFPDGQLHVNLRGFDPSDAPVTAEHAIRGFLQALGIPAEQIPSEPQAQVGLYRSVLAGRRMLIILDNARDERQVRPLLPASPGCLILVTSRQQLTGLIAAEGARPLPLDLLSDDESADLLAGRIDAGRLHAEPAAARQLIRICAGLPLALAVTAARAAVRPCLPLADIAAELGHEQDRLTPLDAGDPATSVRAAFGSSYRGLSGGAARLFRLAALHPGPDLTVYAAASLTGLPLGQARQAMDELARASLLNEHRTGRFTCHDLLRAYAAEVARAHHDRGEQRAALTGLFDYYLAAASAAMDTLLPTERERRPRCLATADIPPLDTPAAAHAWLDTEQDCLVAIAACAADHGWPGYATRLAGILYGYLNVGAHYAGSWALHAHALHAARQAGDRAAHAAALMGLGLTDYAQGRLQQATDHLQPALALYREIGDRLGEGRALGNLGLVSWAGYRCEQAVTCHRQALAIFDDLGDKLRQAQTLSNLGLALSRQRRYPEALDHHGRALALSRELGDRNREGIALANLGHVLMHQGRLSQAGSHLERALAINREIGDRLHESRTLHDLGQVLQRQGEQRRALDHHQRALEVYRELGSLPDEARALNDLGEILRAGGHSPPAADHHAQALAVASQIGDKYEQARAHVGLGHASCADDPGRSRREWERALALYTSLGVPEAGELRALLVPSARLPRSRTGAPPYVP